MPSQPMTLPGRYYTDAETFRREMEDFFLNSWVYAGRANEIPNPCNYFLRNVAGESVIVLRDQNGAVRAHYNLCRHRGTRLCTDPAGAFPGRIQCPYHGWTYSLDGRLVGAPHMNAESAREDYPLHSVESELWDGHIFLHLGRSAITLREQLSTLPEKFAAWRMQDLRSHHRISYDVHANWKLVIQNYNECLHCPLIHPALNRLTDYLGADNEAPGKHYMGGAMGFRAGAETMSIDGVRRRECIPGLKEEQRKRVYYYVILPNLLLSLHPDYMMTHTVWPRDVDRTEIVCEWHFHPEAIAKPDFFADDAVEFWDSTNREDWRIVELSQAGISSRAYTPGPYSPREELLHVFDEIVLARESARKTPPHC